MRQKLFFPMTVAFGTLGIVLIPAVTQAQNASAFTEVNSLFGVKMLPSSGNQNTVSVATGAYYLLNGVRHNIQGVIGVYELFNHATNSPLPGSSPFPLMQSSGGTFSRDEGNITEFSAFTASGSGFSSSGLLTSAGSGVSHSHLHTWELKTSSDSMVFGYEANNNSLAIRSAQSLRPFVFAYESPLMGFHVLDADGGSSYISNRPDPIPEGSGLLGFSCLTILGSFSLLQQRTSKVRA